MNSFTFLYALTEVNPLNLGFILMTLFGISLQVIGLGFLIRFKMRQIPLLKSANGLPGVSIVKTCYKNEDNEEENLDSFFNQDYLGSIQILFVVSDESDPIVPLILKYLAKYPAVNAQLVVSRTRKAFWKKVDALYDAHREIKHEIVIWSDSDVIVKENYVTQMVACLQEPGVSVVTTPQYDTRANTFASALKTLGNNCDIATYMMIFDGMTPRKKAAFGQSIGFWKAEMDSFGEEIWSTMNVFLADDQALPFIFYHHGKKVVFRNIYCPVEFSNKKLEDVVRQKYRWLVPQKMAIGSRYTYLASTLTYPVIVSSLWMLLSGFSIISIWFFAFSCLTRFIVSFTFEGLMLQQFKMTLRYFWVIPIWDFSQFVFCIIGFFKNTMKFGNRTFKVVNRYYLEEILEEPGPLEAPSKEVHLAKV